MERARAVDGDYVEVTVAIQIGGRCGIGALRHCGDRQCRSQIASAVAVGVPDDTSRTHGLPHGREHVEVSITVQVRS